MTDATLQWLDCAWDSFYWNLHEGDYASCKSIIQDTRGVDKKAAKAMQEFLNNHPAKSFLTPSPF